MTFESAAQQYLEHRIAEGYSPRSFGRIRESWLPAFGQRDIGEIQTAEITAEANRLTRERKWRDATRTNAIHELSGLMSWAVQHRTIGVNPCALAPRKTGDRLQNTRTLVPTKNQMNSILKYLRIEPRAHDLVVFACSTGLRFGKLVALRPSDVRTDNDGSIHVEVYDKNRKLHRVYLYGEAKEIAIKASGARLLPGPRGGRIREKWLRPVLRFACQQAGVKYSGRDLDGWSFHSTRRYFATNLINAGVPLEDVMAAGNWRSWAAVKRYAILGDTRKKAAFKTASKILE